MTVTCPGSQAHKRALLHDLNLSLHEIQRTSSLACLLPNPFSSFPERLKPSAFHHQPPCHPPTPPHLTPGSPGKSSVGLALPCLEAIGCGRILLQGPASGLQRSKSESGTCGWWRTSFGSRDLRPCVRPQEAGIVRRLLETHLWKENS